MPDCLICLETTQDTWTPLLNCECLPILHRACWKQWVLQSGAICVICREREEEQEVIEHPHPPIIWVDPYQSFNNMLFVRFCALILFYFSIYGVNVSVHDEL
jgi:hypothetical protein